MKEIFSKIFRFAAASIGLLIAAYTVGWSGAITLHNMFKTEKAEAQQFVTNSITSLDDKWTKIRESDLDV